MSEDKDKKKITTKQLLSRLLNTLSFDKFIQRYDNQMEVESFPAYINRLCEEKDILPAQVIKKVGIDRTYGHQFFNGQRKPNRDKVILLAFGLGLNYTQTKELLYKAHKPELHPKVKRDAAIIFALERGIDLVETQNTLEKLGLTPLGNNKNE